MEKTSNGRVLLYKNLTQLTFTCSKSVVEKEHLGTVGTVGTVENYTKYVQS